MPSTDNDHVKMIHPATLIFLARVKAFCSV